MSGQASLALELEEQDPQLDSVLVAVGGGGLLAGMASWYGRRVRLVGVEPEGAPTCTRALEAGRPVDAEAGSIAADSLAPRRIGELAFPVIQSQVDRVVLVSDEDIRAAQVALWHHLRLVAEPGGAAARLSFDITPLLTRVVDPTRVLVGVVLIILAVRAARRGRSSRALVLACIGVMLVALARQLLFGDRTPAPINPDALNLVASAVVVVAVAILLLRRSLTPQRALAFQRNVDLVGAVLLPRLHL